MYSTIFFDKHTSKQGMITHTTLMVKFHSETYEQFSRSWLCRLALTSFFLFLVHVIYEAMSDWRFVGFSKTHGKPYNIIDLLIITNNSRSMWKTKPCDHVTKHQLFHTMYPIGTISIVFCFCKYSTDRNKGYWSSQFIGFSNFPAGDKKTT